MKSISHKLSYLPYPKIPKETTITNPRENKIKLRILIDSPQEKAFKMLDVNTNFITKLRSPLKTTKNH